MLQKSNKRSFRFHVFEFEGRVFEWFSCSKNKVVNCSQIWCQEQLKEVQELQATHGAFAAILRNGQVITWGHADYGGDSSMVELRNVVQVQAGKRHGHGEVAATPKFHPIFVGQGLIILFFLVTFLF